MISLYSNKSTVAGFFWRFLERCGAQGVTFVVSIVLARLLDPETYGTVALVSVFTLILHTFIDSGMGSALIQKKDADDLDFSSIFYFNIAMSVVLYTLMFFAAPLIATFYDRPELTSVVRVCSLSLLIAGMKNVQQAYVSKYMLFKRFFFATLAGTLGAAVIGIAMAWGGFGVWALVCQSLFNSLIDTVVLWFTVKWRPKRMFSFKRLKPLFAYGWKLLASSLINTGYNNLQSLIIGKKYSSEDLAFYNKGGSFPKTIINNVNSSIDSVLFPTLSAEQDNPKRIRSMTRKSMKISTYVMAPFLLGFSACAEPIVRILLTERWLPCVFFLRIFCFTYTFYPIHTANLNAIKAMGRSDWFFRLEILKTIVGFAAVLITMWISVEAMAYSLLVTSVLSQIINSWPNRKLLNYSYLEQLKDILPGILLAVFMATCVFTVQFLHLNDWLTLLIQVPLGGIIYIGLSKLFKLESFEYILEMTKNFITERKERKKTA